MKKINFIYIIPILFISIIFHKQLFDISWTTFNFADNWGYFYGIYKIKDMLLSWEIPSLVSPLYQFVFLTLWEHINNILLFNLVVFLSIFLWWMWAYKLFLHISNNNTLGSIIGATFFSFSSLVIYANWFNLLWFTWIPFLLHSLILWKKKNIFIFSMLLNLSWHYFLLLNTFLILSFFIYDIFLNKNYKQILKKKFIIFLSFLIPMWIYYLWFISWIKEDIDASTIIKAFSLEDQNFDLKYLFIPNNHNFITNTYWPLLDKDFFNRLIYSLYIWIIWLIVFLYSILVKKHDYINKYYYLFIIIFIFSILFLAWNNLYLWNIKIFEYMPFDIFQILWIDWIFRKPYYFFYLLTFAIWWIIAINFKLNHFWYKQEILIIIAILISLWIVLENNFSFSRSTHAYKNYDFEEHLEKSWNILSLPNTWYSVNKNCFLLIEKGFKCVEYPDDSVPIVWNKYDFLFDSCVMSELLLRPNKSDCINNKNFFQKENISQILLFKKDYIVFFFYESDGTFDNYYLRTKNIIENYNKIFQKKYENDYYIIYNIIK